MTMVFALTENQETLWQIANWAGLAVVVAVALLLTILVLLVHRIDKRVKNIKATLTQAEANTADAELLNTTAAGVDLVLAEGLEHHLFLGRVLGKVRS
jgi:F0F1-type ATP synthase membrane subunit b/b'